MEKADCLYRFNPQTILQSKDGLDFRLIVTVTFHSWDYWNASNETKRRTVILLIATDFQI